MFTRIKKILNTKCSSSGKQPATTVPSPTDYEKANLSVDIVVLFNENPDNVDNVLLIKRKYEPFKGCWALPGGHVDKDEYFETAAARELMEETNIFVEKSRLKKFGTYGDPGRDPRGRTVSIGYTYKLDTYVKPIAGDDAAEAQWFPVDNLPELAFDHEKIIKDAVEFI